MLTPDSSIAAARETVFSDLGDEVAILDLRSGTYFGLNRIGAFVWSLIQSPTTFADVCVAVENEYAVDSHRCAHDLGVLFDELAQHELVVINTP